MFRTEHRAAEVRVDDPVPEGFLHVAYARPTRHAPREMRHDAGIVHEYVDVTEAVYGLLDHGLDLRLIAHVGGHCKDVGLHLAELARHVIQ